MLMKKTSGSSTRTLSIKKPTPKTRRMKPGREALMPDLDNVEVLSKNSTSRSISADDQGAVELQWDNDAEFQFARQLIHLRRLRGKSQAEVAKLMGTSQPHIARIESGSANIRSETLERIIEVLDGRLHVAIFPREFTFRRINLWWESDQKSPTPLVTAVTSGETADGYAYVVAGALFDKRSETTIGNRLLYSNLEITK